ncbi:hypothetical protein Fot_39777 [Forsythia ovata]|uniref:Uncharacterized protein n=1 Tax=Forsythia ovata TaxID=205694 RepID=A0ABD1S5R1_9LAMI
MSVTLLMSPLLSFHILNTVMMLQFSHPLYHLTPNQHNEHFQNDNIDTSPGEATADSSSTDHNSIPLVHVPFPNSPENVSSNNLAPRHSTRQKTKPAWMEDYITSVTESSSDSAADHHRLLLLAIQGDEYLNNLIK